MYLTVLKAQHLSAVAMIDGIGRNPAGGGKGAINRQSVGREVAVD